MIKPNDGYPLIVCDKCGDGIMEVRHIKNIFNSEIKTYCSKCFPGENLKYKEEVNDARTENEHQQA